MNPIVLTVLILAVISLLSGLILSIAAIVMAVKKDETAEKIEGVLPGANCGSCGFSGCSGYASALAKGETTETTMCSPGGAAVASQIATILGVDGGAFVQRRAVVKCRGKNDVTSESYDYEGMHSCAAANRLFFGMGACRFGCIGFGDCVSVCDKNAISVQDGVAYIDESLCMGCGKCAKACPKGLIEVITGDNKPSVLCMNHDKDAQTRKVCSAGCIGCGLCMKNCENDAVKVVNFCAHIDAEKCIGCGKCETVCPQKCII